MRGFIATLSVLALAASACGGGDSAATPTGPTSAPAPGSPATTAVPGTTGAPAATPPLAAPTTETPATTGPPPATTVAPAATSTPPTTGPPAPTTTLPTAIDESLTERTWAVVLVDADDVLNVRTGPGVGFSKLTHFSPTQTGIVLTGLTAQVEGSRWVEVETEDARGWVNSFFLAEEWTTEEVDLNWDLQTPLDDLAAAMADAGDLTSPVSARGLLVVFYDDVLRRWRPSELPLAVVDQTSLGWSTPACLGDCLMATFAEAVAVPFLGVYADIDADAIVALDEILLGGNGPFPPETAIPVQFQNFHRLALHDPGDDPELTGIDWMTWFVYFDYEGGEAKVVALSPAAWGP